MTNNDFILPIIAQDATILQVERAASDIRRGVAVIIIRDDGTQQAIVSKEYTQSEDTITDSQSAAVKLMKIAGMLPVAVKQNIADTQHFLSVTEHAIHHYNTALISSLAKVSEAKVPLEGAEDAVIMAFRPRFGHDEHLAIIIGDISKQKAPLVRVHSSCITGDILGSLRCDCGNQLKAALALIGKEGSGVILYLNQEGRGIGIANKLRAYHLQETGLDTVEANEALGFEADERDFAIAASMLKHIGVNAVTLLTNNPDKIKSLAEYGIEVVKRAALITKTNPHNNRYMDTKARKLGHRLDNIND